MTQTTSQPKHLAPYTCPACGSTDPTEHGYRDGSEAVAYRLRCRACGQGWLQWLALDYIPTGIEIDGEQYDFPPEDAAATQRAYDRLRAFCEAVATALDAFAKSDEPMVRVTRLQLRTLHEDLVREMAAADSMTELKGEDSCASNVPDQP